MPPANTSGRLAGERADDAAMPGVGPGAGELASRNAFPNSAAVVKRSAGSFARPVSTACSMATGIVLRTSVGRSGSALRTFATTAWTLEPVNGGSPVNISYVTAARA